MCDFILNVYTFFNFTVIKTETFFTISIPTSLFFSFIPLVLVCSTFSVAFSGGGLMVWSRFWASIAAVAVVGSA